MPVSRFSFPFSAFLFLSSVLSAHFRFCRGVFFARVSAFARAAAKDPEGFIPPGQIIK
jgi:hypothetical protein